MKTIELTDETYNFLIELSKELNSQDHRSTAMPYFFQIQTQEEIQVPEGYGTEAWFYDGSKIETDTEIKETIFEYKGWDFDDDNDNKNYDILRDWEREEILEAAGYRKGNYDYTEKYQNAFLTAKACKEHILKNSYHYNTPVDFLSHAFRNPELEKVLKFICELTGGEPHK